MNKLKAEKQEEVIRALVEGCSVRSVERMTGTHRDTILRLMVRVGSACSEMMDQSLRGLNLRHIQMDEIWCYVGKKQRRLEIDDDESKLGDFWTWVALDTDTKLVPCHLVGKRTRENAVSFVSDLASRVEGRVQLSSDALESYVEAVETGFGREVDYGRIVKHYESTPVGPGRYSPPKVTSVRSEVVIGAPKSGACTSHVERGNLTIRMQQRRFTRLTNAFSKKVENLTAAVALHFAWYNFARVHRTLRVTPAMEAGVTGRIWTIRDLVDLA